MFKNNSKNKSKSCIPPGKYIGLCQSLIWRFNLISSRFLPNLVPKSSISKSSASNNAVSKSSHELCWSHLWLWWQLFPNQDRDLNSNVAMSTSDFELLEVQFSSTWEMTWEWSWYLLNPSYMYLTIRWLEKWGSFLIISCHSLQTKVAVSRNVSVSSNMKIFL